MIEVIGGGLSLGKSDLRRRMPRFCYVFLWKNGRRMDYGLYFHGESFAWEVQLRDDGFLEFGQRFRFKEAALRLAAT